MAYMKEEFCLVCRKETSHINGDCRECLKRKQKEREDRELAAFKKHCPTTEAQIEYLFRKVQELNRFNNWLDW